VLLFVLLHLVDFRFELRHHEEGEAPYAKAKAILSDPLSAIVYIVGSIALCYHLVHGFQSALQTLGFNHPKYTPSIKLLSYAFGAIIAIGFASFPLWVW